MNNMEESYLLNAINETKCVIVVKKFIISGDIRRSRLEYVSPNAELLGINVGALKKGYRLLRDYIHPDNREEFMDSILLTRNAGKVLTYVLRMVGDDGEVHSVNITMMLLEDTEYSYTMEFLLKESEKPEAAPVFLAEAAKPETAVPEPTGQIFASNEQVKQMVRSVISLEAVYSTIVDVDGQILMEPIGPDANIGSFYDMFERPFYKELYERMKTALASDHHPIFWEMEDGNPDSRISAAPIIVDGKTIAVWILCAYNQAEAANLKSLNESQWVIAQLISEYLNALYGAKKKTSSMEDAEKQLEYEIKQKEIITDTLAQMSDIDAALDVMFERTGRLMHLDSILFYNVKQMGAEEYSLRKYWNARGNAPDKNVDITWKRNRYLTEEKEALERDGYIIDHNNITNKMRVSIFHGRVRAAMVYPIRVNDIFIGWLLFVESETERIWTESEIRYTRELSRLVKRMMIRQIGDGNARKVNQLLLDAFNHIHAGIFIRDNSTGRILFANRRVSERVGQDLEGQDSRILIPDLKSKYEHLEGMRNYDMTNNKITRWRRYIDSVNDIVDITEIQMEWLNGEPVTFVIMRPAQE